MGADDQTDEPKSMSDKSWNGNATVGLESGLDTLPQSSDSQGTPSSPYRVGKPIFPPRTKIGTKQFVPPRTASGMIVIPTICYLKSILSKSIPPNPRPTPNNHLYLVCVRFCKHVGCI